jgi:hypothetical protein
MAMEWSEALSQGVAVTWSAGPPFMVYRVADHCTRGAGRGFVLRHFASTPTDGLTTVNLFVDGTPRLGELTTALSSSLDEQAQPLEAIAVAFNGRMPQGAWDGAVPSCAVDL